MEIQSEIEYLTFDQKSIVLDSLLPNTTKDLFSEYRNDSGYMQLNRLTCIVVVEMPYLPPNVILDITPDEIAGKFVSNSWMRWKGDKSNSIKIEGKKGIFIDYHTMVEFLFDKVTKNEKNWGPARWKTKQVDEEVVELESQLTRAQTESARLIKDNKEKDRALEHAQTLLEAALARIKELQGEVDILVNQPVQLVIEQVNRKNNNEKINEIVSSPRWNELELLVMHLRLYGQNGSGEGLPLDKVARMIGISEADAIDVFRDANDKLAIWLNLNTPTVIPKETIDRYLEKVRPQIVYESEI